MPTPHRRLVELARGMPLSLDQQITPAMAASAIEHGVAPLLDNAARMGGVMEVRDALVELAMHSLESAATTAAASEALRALLDAAERVGIEIGVFKGLAISSRWYPRPELRPAVDVDVFINPDHGDRLGEFVEYLTGKPESRTAIEAMIEEGRVFEYPVLVSGVAVDIHVDPMNLVVPTRHRNLVWQRTEPIPVPDGHSTPTLDLELTIVQALLHLFRDNFADLLHVYDIQLMIDEDPDWSFIESYAADEGLTDLIRFSLAKACDVLDRPSPLSREISPTNRALIGILWPPHLLLRGNESLARSRRRQSLASLLVVGRRLEVARALIGRVFPPRTVIDDRFEGCECPYPIALLRWRLAQRTENKRRNEAPVRRVHAKV